MNMLLPDIQPFQDEGTAETWQKEECVCIQLIALLNKMNELSLSLSQVMLLV